MTLWWRIVKFGFRLLYNELAFTYDTVSKIVSLGAWRCWQRASLAHIPDTLNSQILELAHGTGDLQIDLKNAGYQTIGYDLSSYMGRITQRKLKKHNLPATLLRGQAQTLPFAPDSFLVVISTFPTAFIIAPETLKEIHRVLQSKGKLIIISGGTFVSGGIFKRILEFLYRITGQRSNDSSIPEYLSYFEGFGFDISLHTVPCPRSLAHVIICKKMG